ncbi:bifunctional diguanylate cyclase/phosphodiesterase [Undibacterium sp. WLHG33]|uniref:bifunctional diguanylate cyclase/phosphodiesterase n=1 Tax=Undibacterium sp. WLHG33 TaxID=3412482 RepID=UPI003C2DBD77
MTLRRQLLIAISIIFAVVFFGLQTLSVLSTKDFLKQQLASHAQDAATSLSKSLEDALSKQDLVLAEIQISSMFDRGYFQKIMVISPRGETLISKEMPVAIENVPSLFSHALPLDTPPGEALISSGWRQLGKLVVVSQPTFAYQYLWASFKNAMWWMISMYLISIVLTILLLRLILNPLLQIENAALEIRNKRFTRIEVLPSARELRRVVTAMNAMSGKISEILDAEVAKAEDYRKQAYTDKVTGLDNRQGFDLRFNHLLDEKNFSEAVIFVLEIDGLKEFNNARGYRSGDAVLATITRQVEESFGSHISISGRIGGAAFAFVLLEKDLGWVQTSLIELSSSLQDYFQLNDIHKLMSFCIGGSEFTPDKIRPEIFTKADMAIETARQSAAREPVLFKTSDTSVVEGSGAWRSLIVDALAENRWALFVQSVVSLADGKLFQHEIFSRLVDKDGKYVPAGKFMPMALRHQLMEDIDKAVISATLDMLAAAGNKYKEVAINISVQSIANPEFIEWLTDKLKHARDLGRMLSFELSEMGCARDIDVTSDFVNVLRQHHVKFGIDHFGLDSHSLEVLREVPPDYIKLDGGLVKGILDNPVAHDHLRSIIRLAASLEIPVIAQNVESQELKMQLFEDSVNYGQGYFLGEPEKA